MTLEQLKQRCKDWTETDEDFASIVRLACTLGVNPVVLANEFQVAESTISRWASGISTPLPAMQKYIINSISQHIAKKI